MTRSCPACDGEEVAAIHVLRNLLFDDDEQFRYLECDGCHSLRIETVPADLARHYPEDYYSQAMPGTDSALKRLALRALTKGWERDGTAAGRIAERIRPRRIPAWSSSIGRDEAILDVGSGGGEALYGLAQIGYRDLTGVDPYLRQGLVRPDFTLRACELSDLDRSFDVIMFHHSLEHVPDPRRTLEVARHLLSPKGRILIRVPIVGTAAWREYGYDWVQLDPPRHLTLFSRRGLTTVIDAAGLRIDSLEFDSYALQFWGSEMARRRIPVMGADVRSLFSPAELASYEARAQELNGEEDGDQVSVVARPAG